jgi:ATP-binding cassette subfamily D (ALD) protein 3
MGNTASVRKGFAHLWGLPSADAASVRQRVLVGGGLSGIAAVLYVILRKMAATREKDAQSIFERDGSSSRNKSEKVAVDLTFLKHIAHLLSILVPGPLSKESGYLVMVALAMLSRTWCDVWMLRNGTAIERTIVTRDYRQFLVHFFHFIMAFFPLAVINNLLKYGLDELHLRFRSRLTKYLFAEYMKGFTYYKVGNLDNRIANADQLITQDVDKFCYSVSQLYSNISKPILDIYIYARRLTGSIGLQGPLSMLGYLVVSGIVLTRLRRPIGRFTVTEQKLEGEFRYVNSRLITHSEEIAFYRGNIKEKAVLDATFHTLVRHLRMLMQFRFGLGVIDSIIAKYCATVVGYLVVSRPFFDMSNPKYLNASHSDLMEDYYRSGRMLMNMAMAVGRLVLAGRELTRLAGYTARVIELERVLKDLNAGRYVRTMVTSGDKATAQDLNLLPNSGRVVHQDHIIKFDNVPIVTPNGDVLIRSMNFEVRKGMNVLVAGPNGCGKSSLFRIVGELWPLFGGTLTKPKPQYLFYVPQKPYLCLGSLRDQVIYPHTLEQMRANGVTDSQLHKYLEDVHLAYLVTREERGWDAVHDWADVLSGGEKQRVAMARLFYHRPQFAILDECTSAVSVDVESFMYERCRELGITLFTVSHRKSLWRHHEYVLQFDGRGAVEFLDMKAAEVYGS